MSYILILRGIKTMNEPEYQDVRFIKQIIADTSVPKTYRASFKQYLKWMAKCQKQVEEGR